MSTIDTRLQIKICGLTSAEQALQVAKLDADSIGVVFYPKSPRNVNTKTAREIVNAVRGRCTTCGVFVDMDYDSIMRVIEKTDIDIIQLHGRESEVYIQSLRTTGKKIIKVLKDDTFAEDVGNYSADAYLLELGKGALPGGNFQSWEWGKAGKFGLAHPYVLAGGLSPDNIFEAITKGNPQAIDVSSAVESSPGIKDLDKVREMIEKAHTVEEAPHKERIFS